MARSQYAVARSTALVLALWASAAAADPTEFSPTLVGPARAGEEIVVDTSSAPFKPVSTYVGAEFGSGWGPGSSFTMRLPPDLAGEYELLVTVSGPAGQIALGRVKLSILGSPLLSKITLEPSKVVLSADRAVDHLAATGMSSDGVRRAVTKLGRGTSYSSSDPAVVRVDGWGVLRARAIGSATVQASNGGASASSTVLVTSIPDADRDGVSDLFDACPYFDPGTVSGDPADESDQIDRNRNDIGDACQCGDADGDGSVGVSDLFAIHASMSDAGLRTPLHDLDNDGRIGAGDLARVGDAIFGTCFPVCSRYPQVWGPEAAAETPPCGPTTAAVIHGAIPDHDWGPDDEDPCGSPFTEEVRLQVGTVIGKLAMGQVGRVDARREIEVLLPEGCRSMPPHPVARRSARAVSR